MHRTEGCIGKLCGGKRLGYGDSPATGKAQGVGGQALKGVMSGTPEPVGSEAQHPDVGSEVLT